MVSSLKVQKKHKMWKLGNANLRTQSIQTGLQLISYLIYLSLYRLTERTRRERTLQTTVDLKSHTG